VRIDVIRRRDAYDRDQAAFLSEWHDDDMALRARIVEARGALARVDADDAILRDCAKLCVALGSDGLRGELTLLRAARALAAFEDAPAVTRDPPARRGAVRAAPPPAPRSAGRGRVHHPRHPHGGGGAGVTDATAAPDAEERWQRANLALACFALDPSALGGIWLRARVGPVRDRFLKGFDLAVRGKTVSRLHPDIGDDALFGGIDLAATLGAGTVTRTAGLLDRPGVLVLPMAERAKPRLAARLARALDNAKGLSLVALDEGAGPEERIPEALADRLAIHLDLSDIPLSDAPDLASTPTRLSKPAVSCPASPSPTARSPTSRRSPSGSASRRFARRCRRLRWPAPVPRSPVRPRWASPTS
jgi:hypothetical protein